MVITQRAFSSAGYTAAAGCRLLRAALFAVCCAALSSCAPGEAHKQPIRVDRSAGHNVILVVVDCLRPDHLGFNGYFRDTSPHIDAFASQSISFDQAVTQATWTLPSHASLFTSQYVSRHTVDSKNRKLADSELTLAEILKIHGFKTAAFVNGILLCRTFGMDQGFDVYQNDSSDDRRKKVLFENRNLADAGEWLRRNKDSRFFLFLHINDVHPPYHLPEPYENMYDRKYRGILDKFFLEYEMVKKIGDGRTFFSRRKNRLFRFSRRDMQHVAAHYDAGVSYADAVFGKITALVRDLGLWEKTVIILISDHGDALGENAERRLTRPKKYDFGHDEVYFDEVLRVPFFIRYPGIAGTPYRINTQAQLIDVLPTILDFAGIAPLRSAQGNSLVPLIEGRAAPEFNAYVFSETRDGYTVVRNKEWKLVCRDTERELYHLARDPKERRDVSGRYPRIVAGLFGELEAWRARNREKGYYEETGEQ